MFIGTPGRHLSPLLSPNDVHRHSWATLTPIIVAQRCWPDIFTHFTNPSLTQKPRLFTTSLQAALSGRHFRPLSLPNGTPWHYRATLSPIIVAQRCWPDIFTHFTNPSLPQKPRLFSTSLQARTLRRHLSLLSSPNGVHRHSRATLTPIIVAQGYWPDIFTHFTNPSLTQKPRLFSTSLQARTLRRHLRPLSLPNGTPWHSRATLSAIIVAQRYSLALPGDTFGHYRRPTVLA